MKICFALFLFILPFIPQAQEIKSNVTDGFTNERTIETTLVTLKQGFTTGLGVSFTAVNSSYYLNVIGYGKSSTTINEDDSVWFVLNNGAIAKLNSQVQLAGEQSNFQNMYLQHYYISGDVVEAFKDHPAVMVRIISGAGSNDIAISKKSSKALAKLSEIFLKEVSKQ